MPGRPDGREGVTLAFEGVVHRAEDRPDGAKHCDPARFVDHRVEKERAAASGAHRGQAIEVRAGMHGQDGLEGRRRGLTDRDSSFPASALE